MTYAIVAFLSFVFGMLAGIALLVLSLNEK